LKDCPLKIGSKKLKKFLVSQGPSKNIYLSFSIFSIVLFALFKLVLFVIFCYLRWIYFNPKFRLWGYSLRLHLKCKITSLL